MNSPTHDDVARRAQDLWRKRRCPVGQDNQIWLSAERQLMSEAAQAASAAEKVEPRTQRPPAAAAAPRRHGKASQPPASAVESHSAPPMSEGESLKAGLQITEAREPILPTKSAPVAAVANSGKPLWDRTHAF